MRRISTAIIVAVPDHWHKQVVVDAVTAGKDVYCEKPMSHTPADGLEMVAAAKKTDRIVQIGCAAHQFGDLREGQGADSTGRHRRIESGRS